MFGMFEKHIPIQPPCQPQKIRPYSGLLRDFCCYHSPFFFGLKVGPLDSYDRSDWIRWTSRWLPSLTIQLLMAEIRLTRWYFIPLFTGGFSTIPGGAFSTLQDLQDLFCTNCLRVKVLGLLAGFFLTKRLVFGGG